MPLTDLILQSFWFLLPAGFANMAPVLFKNINFLNYPIDFDKSFHGRPIFGHNKTFRGFFFGILTAILIVYLQSLLNPYLDPTFSLVDYNQTNIFILGFLLGFGALLGDLVKSFFKRRANIEPGESWMPFDQIDWVLGALLVTSIYIVPSLNIILISLILFSILHIVINYLGYTIGIKRNKF
jgi:CDP-2,3-bis-(O-geranylgeranyl)-sn-glycerol synthase